ncbi:MAG: hypothetical protein NC432_08625 [Roseburia sp.]|nr:hypothetical protein [Roseburia sp.]MCM1097824.1 hypothetical protein [Ruminococcus flavefaciens]
MSLLKLEVLKEEGLQFLKESQYEELDVLAKMNANAYIKGLYDGQKLKEAENRKMRPIERAAV